jgi:hypothetical protein
MTTCTAKSYCWILGNFLRFVQKAKLNLNLSDQDEIWTRVPRESKVRNNPSAKSDLLSHPSKGVGTYEGVCNMSDAYKRTLEHIHQP